MEMFAPSIRTQTTSLAIRFFGASLFFVGLFLVAYLMGRFQVFMLIGAVGLFFIGDKPMSLANPPACRQFSRLRDYSYCLAIACGAALFLLLMTSIPQQAFMDFLNGLCSNPWFMGLAWLLTQSLVLAGYASRKNELTHATRPHQPELLP